MMKEKIKKIATSNITFGVVGGLVFWGYAVAMDKITNNIYKQGFADGVDAHEHVTEFKDKLKNAMEKQVAED